MKHIFILNDKMTGGGAEAVMRDIVKYLSNRYEITVMTLDDNMDAFQKIYPPHVHYAPSRIKQNPYRRRNPLHYVIAFHNRIQIAKLRRKSFDIAIANKEGTCMKIVSKMRAKKKLAWVHVDYQSLYWTRWIFTAADEVKCMQGFDHVVCVSKAAQESVKKVIGDPGNVCYRYNPINYREIMRMAAETVEEPGNALKPLFVTVGRLDEQKNFPAFVQVCCRLSKSYDFEVWMIGDGEQRGEIEQVLAEEACDCVKLLGWKDNPYKYIVRADVFVSSSLGESYGLAIQEALLLGVPVLSTRCPAIEECFDERFGMLVACEEGSIEEGMRTLLEEPQKIHSFRKNIEEEYDKESLWEQRLRRIEELMK